MNTLQPMGTAMKNLREKAKTITLCGLLLVLSGCVVSETYLVNRCTSILSKIKCTGGQIEINKPDGL